MSKLKAGDMVRVKAGESMPEFPDLDIGGWVAMVLESRGRGEGLKYIVEWTEDTLGKLPEDFKAVAEEQQLATEMACLLASAVERHEMSH